MPNQVYRRSLLLTAASAARVWGANERVRIALIGCGGEGVGIASMARREGAEVVAVADVFEPNLLRAREKLGARDGFRDFRKLLEDRSIDAVFVATPDHWHAACTALACRAGKDVYVEKPLCHNVREGRAMVKAARRCSRIVQMGSQQRSAPHVREAAALVRSGALGEIRFARIWDFSNGLNRRRTADSAPPPGLDWDFFLGPAPQVPYNPARQRSWRNFLDYGGGAMTDMGAHWFDTLHQVMGVDAPLTVSATHASYGPKGDNQTPEILMVAYEYPGFLVSYECCHASGLGIPARWPGLNYYQAKGAFDRPRGVALYGVNGALFLDRKSWEVVPEYKGPGEYKMERKAVDASEPKPLHVANFIECVKSRRTPNADVEVGQRSTTAPHLGNIAWRTGLRLKWNRETEDFAGQPEASRLLDRPPRKDWAWTREA
jgi:predicted dehydrogenase